MFTNEDIGRVLLHLRNSLGLTQREMAEVIGVTFQQMQKYERGTNRISLPSYMNLCESLEINPWSAFDLEKFADDDAEEMLTAFGKLEDPVRSSILTVIKAL